MKFLKENWFIVTILIALLGFILIFYALKTAERDNLLKTISQTGTTKTNQANPLREGKHNTYSNTYYNYSIEYPESWSRGATAGNNDGVIFNTGDSDVNIRVYASRYSPENNPYSDNKKETLLLDNGDSAQIVQGTEPGKRFLEIFLIKEGYFYSFFALVPEKFFQENKEMLMYVARTLDVKGM